MEPIIDECLVSLRSNGFEDAGCNADDREECSVIRIEQEANGVFDEYRPLTPDPSTGVERGIVVTTFDPQACGIGVRI